MVSYCEEKWIRTLKRFANVIGFNQKELLRLENSVKFNNFESFPEPNFENFIWRHLDIRDFAFVT